MKPTDLKAADLFLEAFQAYSDGNERRAFQLTADARRIWEWSGHIVPHPALANKPLAGDWSLAKYRNLQVRDNDKS